MADIWWVKPDQLDSDQKDVVKLPGEGSYLVQGPPGSGKTNLLLLRANYISLKGKPNLLILTFTRTLKEFIAMGGKEYSFPLEKIQTHISWTKDFLRMFGVMPDNTSKFESLRKNLAEQIKQLIVCENVKGFYDAILLDEAQDYLPEEIENFKHLSNTIFAVADSHQKIYATNSPLEVLKSVVDDVHSLSFHYRNGYQICRLAEEVMRKQENSNFMSDCCKYDEIAKPSTAESVKCDTFEQQCEKMIESLKIQVEAYPDELLGVICPTNEDLDHVWETISHSDLYPVSIKQSSSTGYDAFTPETRICFTTIHSAKGLEFRTLHIPCISNIRVYPLQINICFTAITRAKTSLAVYHYGSMPGYLESAFAQVNSDPLEPLPDPDFDQIFGGN